MADDRKKVILDTDIGSDIDDAVALAYLLCQERCELLGVTTVSGEPQKRAEMVSAMCRHVGRDDIPIHSGCPAPLFIEQHQKHAQQAAALGSRPRRADFEPGTAVEFLRRTIRQHPGEVTLLAIGPMTNVGLLFAADPEIPAMLKEVVLMAGLFFEGKRGRWVEWNECCDPHAAAIVYGNGPQARPPRLISYGLDVTLRCTMDSSRCRQRFTARVLEPVRDFAEVWFQHTDRIVFHDPLAAACVFEPDLCRYQDGFVTLSLHEPTLGWTVFDPNAPQKAHRVASDVDAERFFEHYFSVVR